MTDHPPVRRVERYAVAWCAALAAIALAVEPRAAIGVLGGGAIVGVSYWAIKRGVGQLVRDAPPGGATGAPRRIALTLLLFAGRYALLAGIAYVMIARLRLHPVGLLVGASSIVLAIATEALRFGWRSSSTRSGSSTR